MSAPNSTPRILPNMLDKYRGQIVTIVGKLESDNGRSVVLDLAPHGQAIVNKKPDTNINTKFVQFIGSVQDDLSISEHSHTDFGDNFDITQYAEMIQATLDHPEMF